MNDLEMAVRTLRANPNMDNLQAVVDAARATPQYAADMSGIYEWAGGYQNIAQDWLRQQILHRQDFKPVSKFESSRPPIIETAIRAGIEVKRRGAMYMARCPYHTPTPGSNSHSLQLYPQDNRFWCHSCNSGGDSHQLKAGTVGYGSRSRR